VIYAAFDSIEHILAHEECDVDPINRMEKATPLHYVNQIEDADLRAHIFESLLDAGADYTLVTACSSFALPFSFLFCVLSLSFNRR
jgi:hypothetical protein